MKNKSKKKKKFEWSKLFAGTIAFVFGIYGLWCGYEYYRLTQLAIETFGPMPDATLAVTCASVVLSSLLSYCLYQLGLKNSRNKYGIDANGEPFKIESEYAQAITTEDREAAEVNDQMEEQK